MQVRALDSLARCPIVEKNMIGQESNVCVCLFFNPTFGVLISYETNCFEQNAHDPEGKMWITYLK